MGLSCVATTLNVVAYVVGVYVLTNMFDPHCCVCVVSVVGWVISLPANPRPGEFHMCVSLPICRNCVCVLCVD